MMKIGFDAKRANANNTGLGNYSRFVISALAEFMKGQKYLLYIPKRKDNREYDALLNDFDEVEERLPLRPLWRGILKSLWRIISIKNDLKREGVEIFHGLSNEIPIGLQSAGIKSVVTIHDLIFLRLPSHYKAIDRWIYTFKFQYACKHADRIIAVSERTKCDIVEIFGTDPSRIEVIYQGCAEHFAVEYSQDRRDEVRAKYELPEKFVLNVGTLEERKNLMLCVMALEHLPDDLHLVACGRATPYLDRVMEYAAEHGLTSRIKLIHKSQYCDLPVIYQCSEVFLYPSIYEGFGIPIIEALSSGVPVVAATGSCLEEAGGDAARYVEPTDADAFAAEITSFIEDQELRADSIKRGKAYVKRFSKELIAKQISDLYHKL